MSEPSVTGDGFLRSDGGSTVDAGLIDDCLLHRGGSARRGGAQRRRKESAKSTGVAVAGCEVETRVKAPQSDHGSLSEQGVTGDGFLRSDGGNAVDAGLIDDGILHSSGSAKRRHSA